MTVPPESLDTNGGHDAEDWLAKSTAADEAPEQVAAALALFVGIWAEAVCQPEPPGIVGLRHFQRAHLAAAQAWLDRRWI